MNVKTFIDRPITSVMISVTIVIIGIISLVWLPLEQYPDIAPPTVKVTATYTGASTETVMKSVVAPLEAATVMIFGMLPLMLSSVAGARGNIATGAGVLGGMVVGTVALLFFVPMLFCLFERLDEKWRGKKA